MDDDLQKLKLLNIRDIHDKTHISIRNIEYILLKSFDKLDKIQFSGFVSILEREYSLNLQVLKDEYQEYYLEQSHNHDDAMESIPLKPNFYKQKRFRQKIIITSIIIILLIITYVVLISQFKSTKQIAHLQSNNLITTNKKNVVITDQNISIKPVTAKKSMKIQKPSKIKFITNSKLWIGITNLDTWKQTQKIIKHDIELNATKNYLFVLGHGMIKVNVGDKNITFPHVGKVWLMFKDGNLTKLTHKDYEKLNKGKSW